MRDFAILAAAGDLNCGRISWHQFTKDFIVFRSAVV